MLNRKKYLILTILLIILTITSLAAYAAKDVLWENAGKDIKKINEDPNKDSVVALVYGNGITKKEITKKDVESKKAFLTLQGEKPSANEILDAIAYDKIVVQESKKRNLYPSRKETIDYMEKLRNIQEEAIKNGAETDETYEEWKDYLAGRGMTEDEFWESDEAIAGYQNSLAIAKLRSVLQEEWGFTPEKFMEPQKTNEFEEKFQNSITKNVKQVKKEIIDESVFE